MTVCSLAAWQRSTIGVRGSLSEVNSAFNSLSHFLSLPLSLLFISGRIDISFLKSEILSEGVGRSSSGLVMESIVGFASGTVGLLGVAFLEQLVSGLGLVSLLSLMKGRSRLIPRLCLCMSSSVTLSPGRVEHRLES